MIFGTDTLNGLTGGNPFIVKYNAAGTQKWAYSTKQKTQAGLEFLNVKVSKADKLYFYARKINGGAYVNTFHFPVLKNSGSSDRWIACFDTMMTNIWYRYIKNCQTNTTLDRAGFGVSDINDVYIASTASSNSAMQLGKLDTIVQPGFGIFTQYKNFTAVGNPGGTPGDFAFIAKYAADTTFTTNIQVPYSSEGIQIYPNPAQNIVSIKNTNGKDALLEIYSIQGRLVKHIEIQTEISRIEVGDLQKGLYFILVRTNGRTVAQKLILQ